MSADWPHVGDGLRGRGRGIAPRRICQPVHELQLGATRQSFSKGALLVKGASLGCLGVVAAVTGKP